MRFFQVLTFTDDKKTENATGFLVLFLTVPYVACFICVICSLLFEFNLLLTLCFNFLGSK